MKIWKAPLYWLGWFFSLCTWSNILGVFILVAVTVLGLGGLFYGFYYHPIVTGVCISSLILYVASSHVYICETKRREWEEYESRKVTPNPRSSVSQIYDDNDWPKVPDDLEDFDEP